MRVVPIAWTMIQSFNQLFDELGFDLNGEVRAGESDLDILGEFAGRNCYQSFPKPNPATRTNHDYLAHILEVGHESVLEHSSVTFYVDGVSRNLLLELERHRHLSFSNLSTRYVAPDKMDVVLHPNTPDNFKSVLIEHDQIGRTIADNIFEYMVDMEWPKKQAREVSRQHLGGNTETKMVVTGNLRTWRYVISQRMTPGADAEIQEFAREVLKSLKKLAPNTFQDMEL